jgi:hypothetical protein
MEIYLVFLVFVSILLYNSVKKSYNNDKSDNRCTFFPEGNWSGC